MESLLEKPEATETPLGDIDTDNHTSKIYKKYTQKCNRNPNINLKVVTKSQREKRTKRNCGNNQKTSSHIITPYLSIIIINLNRLMLQLKEIQRMNEKTRTIYMMLTRDSHQFFRNKLKVGGWKKVN